MKERTRPGRSAVPPKRRRLRRSVVAVGVAALLTGLVTGFMAGPVPSTAFAADAGSNWWYDAFGVEQVQADGFTGEGVTVAVIDRQIDPDLSVFTGADLTVDKDPLCASGQVTTKDTSASAAHGSDVTALVVGNGTGTGKVRGIAPRASVTFYGLGVDAGSAADSDCSFPSKTTDVVGVYQGIRRALDDGARIISISQGVPEPDRAEAAVLAEAVAAGVVIVAAVPNVVTGSPSMWPWSANGVVAVNAFDSTGELQRDQKDPSRADVWPGTTVVAPGVDFPSVVSDEQAGPEKAGAEKTWTTSGSSLATPLTAGALAVVAQKYPQASGNQLVQSLIHNTTRDDHELARTDALGYGPVSLRHMLREDPAQYDQANPLMDKPSGVPSAAQVAEAARNGHGQQSSAAPTPAASESSAAVAGPGTGDAGAGSGLLTPLLWAGVVLAVLVVSAVIVIVVFTRRKKAGEGVS